MKTSQIYLKYLNEKLKMISKEELKIELKYIEQLKKLEKIDQNKLN